MFKLRMSTGNEAFTQAPERETARLLRQVADRLEAGTVNGSISDANGNQVGTFDLTGTKS